MLNKTSLFLTISATLLSYSSLVLAEKVTCMICVAKGLTWDVASQSCNSVSSIKNPIDCYRQVQAPLDGNSFDIDDTLTFPMADIKLTQDSSSNSQEYLLTAENKMDKDVVIELQCTPGSKLIAYAATGTSLVSVE